MKMYKGAANIFAGMALLAASSLAPTKAFTATNFRADKLPRLSTVVLTLPEYLKSEASGLTYFGIDSELVTQRDVTPELDSSCALDCAKTIWQVPVTTELPDGYVRLTTVLVRFSSAEKARSSIGLLKDQLRKASGPEWYEYDRKGFDFARLLPDESYAFYDGRVVLITRRGSVMILLIQKMRGFRDVDVPGELGSLEDVAALQLEKLETAGYPE